MNLTGNQTINLPGGTTVGRLLFSDTGVPTFNYTLGGSAVTLDNTGGVGGNPPVIDTQLAGQTVTVDNTLTGSAGFTKAGTGTLILGTATTFTGGTITVAGGVMRTTFAGEDALNRPVVVTGSGTRLELGGTDHIRNAVPSITVQNGAILRVDGGAHQRFSALTLSGGVLVDTGAGAGSYQGSSEAPGNYSLDSFVMVSGAGISNIMAAAGAHLGNTNSLAVASLKPFNVVSAGGTLTVNARLLNSADQGGGSGFRKIGAGVMFLNHSNNTYSGETYVQGGQLRVNGTLASVTNPLSGQAAKVVVNGGTLGGAGTINRPITVDNAAGSQITGGSFRGAGTLTVGGNVTLDRTGGPGGPTPGTWPPARASRPPRPRGASGGTKDQLNITGDLTLTGGLIDVYGVTGHGFDPTKHYSWKIANVSGTVTGLDTAAFNSNLGVPSNNFSLTFDDPGDSVYLNFTPVPEPGAVLGIAVAGLAGVGLVRRWRAAGRRAAAPGAGPPTP